MSNRGFSTPSALWLSCTPWLWLASSWVFNKCAFLLEIQVYMRLCHWVKRCICFFLGIQDFCKEQKKQGILSKYQNLPTTNILFFFPNLRNFTKYKQLRTGNGNLMSGLLRMTLARFREGLNRGELRALNPNIESNRLQNSGRGSYLVNHG